MKPYDQFAIEEFDRMVAVNVRAVFAAVQAAAPQMGEGGRILNIGSINADSNPFPGNSLYVMSKAAVAGLTRGLARDLAPQGITVNNVQPGPTDTDMNPANGPYAPVVTGLIPVGRYGTGAEIADMVAYLATPGAAFVTGATINVDLAFVAAAGFFPKEQSNKAIAYVFTGGTVGMVLGVPITSYIADQMSLEASFLFSAAVNAIAFIAFLSWVPSMPVKVKLTYKKQLGVLAKPQLWLNIAAICLIISAKFAVFSYFAEYLGQITKMNGKWISAMLIVFGASGVLGNLQAGKFLSKNVIKTTILYPSVLAITFLFVFFAGNYMIPMAIVVIAWGAIHTGGFIIHQNWLASESSEAPEFGNSLFVSFSNLGIALGTASGGLFLLQMGTHQIIWGGLLFLALGLIGIVAKIKVFGPAL